MGSRKFRLKLVYPWDISEVKSNDAIRALQQYCAVSGDRARAMLDEISEKQQGFVEIVGSETQVDRFMETIRAAGLQIA